MDEDRRKFFGQAAAFGAAGLGSLFLPDSAEAATKPGQYQLKSQEDLEKLMIFLIQAGSQNLEVHVEDNDLQIVRGQIKTGEGYCLPSIVGGEPLYKTKYIDSKVLASVPLPEERTIETKGFGTHPWDGRYKIIQISRPGGEPFTIDFEAIENIPEYFAKGDIEKRDINTMFLAAPYFTNRTRNGRDSFTINACMISPTGEVGLVDIGYKTKFIDGPDFKSDKQGYYLNPGSALYQNKEVLHPIVEVFKQIG
ncbi:hypothetical protein ACFL0W_03005 [Nanoarchaeota archaeon]